MRRINLLQRDNDDEFDEVLSERQILNNIQSGNKFPEDSMEFQKGSTKLHKVLPSSRRFHRVPKGSTNWPQAKRI